MFILKNFLVDGAGDLNPLSRLDTGVWLRFYIIELVVIDLVSVIAILLLVN